MDNNSNNIQNNYNNNNINKNDKKENTNSNKPKSNKIIDFNVVKLDKRIYVFLAVGIILLVVAIVFLVKKFNDVKGLNDLGEVTYDQNTNSSEYKEAKKVRSDRLQQSEATEHRGLDNLPRLDHVNYSSYADIQFAAPSREEDELVLTFLGYENPVRIKLFNKLAPETVADIEEAVENGYLDGKVVSMETFSDIIVPVVDEAGSGVITSYSEDELNFSLVPYKGALVYNQSGAKKGIFGRSFSIIMDNREAENYNVINNMALNYTMKRELKKRNGGRLENVYLKNVVFGQVYEGIETLDEIVSDYIEQKENAENQGNFEGVEILNASIVRAADRF